MRRLYWRIFWRRHDCDRWWFDGSESACVVCGRVFARFERHTLSSYPLVSSAPAMEGQQE